MRQLWIMPIAIGLVAFAQASDPPQPTILSVSQAHVEACRVFPTEGEDQAFDLKPEPILRRQQNTVGNSLGYTYLWLDKSGRPAALCDVFYFKNFQENRHMMNEWHALADEPLTVQGPGAKDVMRTFMRSPGAGIDWRAFPETEPPGKTAAARKTQMGRLSKRFSAWLFSSTGERHDLRLLTTPIFTYEAKDSKDFLGGAIYALCVETDPEIMIVLEARQGKERMEWQYAPFATSIERLFLKLDDTEAWSADPPKFHPESAHWKDFIKEVQVPLTNTSSAETPADK